MLPADFSPAAMRMKARRWFDPFQAAYQDPYEAQMEQENMEQGGTPLQRSLPSIPQDSVDSAQYILDKNYPAPDEIQSTGPSIGAEVEPREREQVPVFQLPKWNERDYAKERLERLRQIGAGSKDAVDAKIMAEYDKNPDSTLKNIGKGALLGLRGMHEHFSRPENRNMSAKAALGYALGRALGGIAGNLILKGKGDEYQQYEDDLAKAKQTRAETQQEAIGDLKIKEAETTIDYRGAQGRALEARTEADLIESGLNNEIKLSKEWRDKLQNLGRSVTAADFNDLENNPDLGELALFRERAFKQHNVYLSPEYTEKPDWAYAQTQDGTLVMWDKKIGPPSLEEVGQYSRQIISNVKPEDFDVGIQSEEAIKAEAQAARRAPGPEVINPNKVPKEFKNADGTVDEDRLKAAASSGYYEDSSGTTQLFQGKLSDYYEAPKVDAQSQEGKALAARLNDPVRVARQKIQSDIAFALKNHRQPREPRRDESGRVYELTLAQIRDKFAEIFRDKSLSEKQKQERARGFIKILPEYRIR